MTANSRKVYGPASVRGNTSLTVCPKAPPARREGSSVLSAMSRVVLPKARECEKERNERFAQRRIVRFSLSGLYSQINRSPTALRGQRPRARGGAEVCLPSTANKRKVHGPASVRGNTTLTVCPEAPPARREGSSVLFAVLHSKSPRVQKERNERFAQRRIIRFSLSGLYLPDKNVHRLPCAGGVRVLAAEQRFVCIDS